MLKYHAPTMSNGCSYSKSSQKKCEISPKQRLKPVTCPPVINSPFIAGIKSLQKIQSEDADRHLPDRMKRTAEAIRAAFTNQVDRILAPFTSGEGAEGDEEGEDDEDATGVDDDEGEGMEEEGFRLRARGVVVRGAHY